MKPARFKPKRPRVPGWLQERMRNTEHELWLQELDERIDILEVLVQLQMEQGNLLFATRQQQTLRLLKTIRKNPEAYAPGADC